MKRIYAQQVNSLLEGYHFNIESEHNSRSLSFTALQNGMQHVYGCAFCSGDTDAAALLKPLLIQVLDGEVPQPIDVMEL